jgi:hypothetical protein
VVEDEVARFRGVRLVKRIEEESVTLTHYHAILITLFHQTYSAPFTFAQSAVNCSWKHEAAKDYLLHHAEEERTHWRWVLDDLAATGYSGPDIRRLPPHATCQAFIGLHYYFSKERPIARLGAAAVLEGIGATHGGTYGQQLIQQLSLRPHQASFFLSHAETDKTHIVELRKAIAACELDDDDWLWMEHAARTCGHYYRAMYDHEAFA